ncbi:hypothetical protein PENTCL1PPCAC_24005, partial [Pristionchus entomophagus]
LLGMPRARGGNRSRSDVTHLANTPEQDRLLAFVKHLNLSPEHNFTATAAANSSNQAGSSHNVSLPDSLCAEDSPPVVANTLNHARPRYSLTSLSRGRRPNDAIPARTVLPAAAAAPAAQRRPRRRRGARGGAAAVPHSTDDWAASPNYHAEPEHPNGATPPVIEPPRDSYLNEWYDPTPRDIDEWNWASEWGTHEYGIDTDGWGIEPSDPDYDGPPPGFDRYVGGPPPGFTPTHGDPPGLTRSGARRNRRRRRSTSSSQAIDPASGAAPADEIDPWVPTVERYGLRFPIYFGATSPDPALDAFLDPYVEEMENDNWEAEMAQEELVRIESQLEFLERIVDEDPNRAESFRERILNLEMDRVMAQDVLRVVRGVVEGQANREGETAKAEHLRIAHEANNQPEALALRYSRACGICIAANPRVRVALVECGHLLCEPCVERLDQVGPREVNCPFCRTDSKYIRIFEELEEAADAVAPAATPEQETTADPAPEPTGNGEGPQSY